MPPGLNGYRCATSVKTCQVEQSRELQIAEIVILGFRNVQFPIAEKNFYKHIALADDIYTLVGSRYKTAHDGLNGLGIVSRNCIIIRDFLFKCNRVLCLRIGAVLCAFGCAFKLEIIKGIVCQRQ